MWRMGSKQKVIAQALGIAQGTVSKVLKRNRETGVPTPRARPGRPRKTTEREDRYLLRLCRNGRTKSANTLRAEWLRFTNTPVSRMLVNLRLIRAGYFARRPLKKLLLLQRHRQARMDWARNHLRWRPGHWQHVIFSDESRFLLYRIDGRIRVRRQQHEAYNEDCIVPRVQAGGGGVTIWGAFHHGGKCDLHIVDGNLDQYQYLQILEEKLLPFARLTFGHNFVYQDDNARPHRARTVVNFMETEGIEHMEWPAVSPDMNPIENMWSEVTRTMDASANQPTNLAELRQAVIDAWQALPLQTLATLIDSMPRRVQALYDARGGHTKY